MRWVIIHVLDIAEAHFYCRKKRERMSLTISTDNIGANQEGIEGLSRTPQMRGGSRGCPVSILEVMDIKGHPVNTLEA